VLKKAQSLSVSGSKNGNAVNKVHLTLMLQKQQ
jgi:hypothetical protein